MRNAKAVGLTPDGFFVRFFLTKIVVNLAFVFRLMKKIFIMLLIILSLVLVSCRVREKYDLLETTDDISEITIVELSFDENKKLIETELSKIDDTAAFMEDFRDVMDTQFTIGVVAMHLSRFD